MDYRNLEKLTEKLKNKGDITEHEADRIFSLFSDNSLKTKLNPNSKKYDPYLVIEINKWFKAVFELLEAGKRGNFVTTIPLKKTAFEDHQSEVNYLKKCRDALSPEDCFTKMMIAERTFCRLPDDIKKFFSEDSNGSRKFYCLYNNRAGVYPRFKEIAEQFEPVLASRWPDLCGTGFKIAAGAEEIRQSEWVTGREELYFYVIASFMKDRDISPLCVEFSDRYSFLAADNKSAMKEAMKESPDDLLRSALKKGIISPKMMTTLMKDCPVRSFPLTDFVNLGVDVMKCDVITKESWEQAKREIEEEGKYLDSVY